MAPETHNAPAAIAKIPLRSVIRRSDHRGARINGRDRAAVYAVRFAATIVLAAVLRCAPAAAQGPNVGPEPGDSTNVVRDIKSYVMAPLHARRTQWIGFGAVLGVIAAAHQYDDEVREHFETPVFAPGESPDTHDARGGRTELGRRLPVEEGRGPAASI
jgi:hypothetical protein